MPFRIPVHAMDAYQILDAAEKELLPTSACACDNCHKPAQTDKVFCEYCGLPPSRKIALVREAIKIARVALTDLAEAKAEIRILKEFRTFKPPFAEGR
mgnify:CR=1 FL=1